MSEFLISLMAWISLVVEPGGELGGPVERTRIVYISEAQWVQLWRHLEAQSSVVPVGSARPHMLSYLGVMVLAAEEVKADHFVVLDRLLFKRAVQTGVDIRPDVWMITYQGSSVDTIEWPIPALEATSRVSSGDMPNMVKEREERANLWVQSLRAHHLGTQRTL